MASATRLTPSSSSGTPKVKRAMPVEMSVPALPKTRPTTETNTGLGDVEIGLTKQLFEERIGRPGLLAGLSWKTSTGDVDENGVSLGSGGDALQGSLTAVKRLDPLVLFGSLSYTDNLDASIAGQTVEAGDLIGLKLGLPSVLKLQLRWP